ncbi:hypothetical protein [Priestia megaterium]|uniref:hypothetical protein n=1 Tax=Priestia megaterium TaxID=1404 RepID=UPI00196B8297|nr:hypothetical protein [Priestia megaterium]QSF42404.1 hypothetical protein ICR96_30795 [Priestia megaterium]
MNSNDNINKDNLNLLGTVALGLTTVYTAILATQLMSTKHKVDYLYYKEHFQKEDKSSN